MPRHEKVSSNVELEWGRNLLDKRRWIGNEIVMDAGAGSGNLTKILADKVPYGQIYAVVAGCIFSNALHSPHLLCTKTLN